MSYADEDDPDNELETACDEFISTLVLPNKLRDILVDAIGSHNLKVLIDDHNIVNIYGFALNKYATQLNDPTQKQFKGMESSMVIKPQSISIRNINDILYILDNAGYDNITNFIRTAMKGRVNERHNKYKEYFKHYD